MICKVGTEVTYWWRDPKVLSTGVVLEVNRMTGRHRIQCMRKKDWELGAPPRRRATHTVFHAQIVGKKGIRADRRVRENSAGLRQRIRLGVPALFHIETLFIYAMGITR